MFIHPLTQPKEQGEPLLRARPPDGWLETRRRLCRPPVSPRAMPYERYRDDDANALARLARIAHRCVAGALVTAQYPPSTMRGGRTRAAGTPASTATPYPSSRVSRTGWGRTTPVRPAARDGAAAASGWRLAVHAHQRSADRRSDASRSWPVKRTRRRAGPEVFCCISEHDASPGQQLAVGASVLAAAAIAAR